MKINTEGIFIAPWHLATYEKGGKEQGGCQRAVDLFSYVKILGKPIKKQVTINQCKYVCMKLVPTFWKNWQYALTHKAGPLVPMLNVCTIIGTSTLSIQRESSLLLGTLLIRSKGKKSKVPESIEFIFICEDTVSVSSRGAKPRERETGSLQVAYTMRLVLLNVSLHVLVIKSLQETQ